MILKLIGLQKTIDQLFDDNWAAVWPLDALQKNRRNSHAQHLSKNHLLSRTDDRQHRPVGPG
jgi:hypothetical protein